MNQLIASLGIAAQDKKMNVLFIAVDGLKPLMGASGDKHAKTPGMDWRAREGIAFQNCYCLKVNCKLYQIGHNKITFI